MASSSLSESIHTSPVIHQQLQDDEERNENERETLDSERTVHESKVHKCQKHNDEELNFSLQLRLVMCFIGIEVSSVFTQIFEVLFLQFFGVPTEVLSVCGVITSAMSLLLLLIAQWYSNAGSSVMTRRLMLMLLLLLNYVCCLICLAVCGFLKMKSVDDVLHENADHSRDFTLNETWTAQQQWKTNNLSTFSPVFDSRRINSSTEANLPILEPELPSTSTFRIVLGITAFAFLDTGFDTGMLLTRSFVLDCVPPVQQTRILVLAGTVQSLSGAAFSLINTLDIPKFLGELFTVDGTAASILFLAALITIVEIVAFGCTMITGYRVLKRRNGSHLAGNTDECRCRLHSFSISNCHLDTKLGRSRYKKQTEPNSVSYQRLHASDADELRLPLMNEYQKRSQSYSTMHRDFNTNLSYGKQTQEVESKANDPLHGCGTDVDNSTTTIPGLDVKGFPAKGLYDDGRMSAHNDDSEMNSLEEPIAKQRKHESDLETTLDKMSNTFIDAMKASYSMSLSVVQLNPHRDIHAQSSLRTGKSNKMVREENSQRKSRFFSKRLAILLICSFLAFGALVNVSMYSANVLTIGIYHGDPGALPGTEGNLRYRKGLRQTAWGCVVMYVSYAVTSLCTKKIIDVIGEKLLFTFSHLVFLASTISLLLLKSEELYFVLMLMAGVQRICSHTLNYVMATKLASEQAADKETASKNTGKAIAFVGIGLPLHYLISSAIMGPLMAATGGPWVTLQYVTIVTSASFLIFLLMYIRI